jgi:hypothetical protein
MPAVAADTPDILVENHGSIVLLRPATRAGRLVAGEETTTGAVTSRSPAARCPRSSGRASRGRRLRHDGRPDALGGRVIGSGAVGRLPPAPLYLSLDDDEPWWGYFKSGHLGAPM